MLCELIALHGPDLSDDPDRCVALLNDMCGVFKREIGALVMVQRERAVQELRRRGSDPSIPLDLLIQSLADRLCTRHPIEAESARWAVDSWALALGLLRSAEPDKTRRTELPGLQPPARSPLHFIWIVGRSGSMNDDGKIQALNNAIREAVPHLASAARENPHVELLLSAVSFSGGAYWHVPTPTPVEHFEWNDLTADGPRDMGAALRLVAGRLEELSTDEFSPPPVLVLISDWSPTDDFRGGLRALMDQPWGKKSVRIAIAVGEGADLSVLQEFIGNSEMRPLQANSPEALVNYIKWTPAGL